MSGQPYSKLTNDVSCARKQNSTSDAAHPLDDLTTNSLQCHGGNIPGSSVEPCQRGCSSTDASQHSFPGRSRSSSGCQTSGLSVSLMILTAYLTSPGPCSAESTSCC